MVDYSPLFVYYVQIALYVHICARFKALYTKLLVEI